MTRRVRLDPIPPPRPGACKLGDSRRPPRRGGGGLRRCFSMAHCVNLGKKRMCPLHSLVVKSARVSRAGPAPTWALAGSRGSAPRSPSAEGEIPYPRRRSKRVNSKTVRWTVFEEGKPSKRGFPFEKHSRILPQTACGLTAGASPCTAAPTHQDFVQTNSTSPPSPEGRGWASTRLFTLSHFVNLGKKRMCPLHSLVVKPARGARRTALPLAELTTYVEMFDRRCLRARISSAYAGKAPIQNRRRQPTPFIRTKAFSTTRLKKNHSLGCPSSRWRAFFLSF